MSTACGTLSLNTLDISKLMDPACLKFLVSKVFGYGIVAGSTMVKVPQIQKIQKAGGVGGLSGSSIILETLSCIANVAYNFGLGYPFSVWGENFFLTLQNSAITALYFHYTCGIGSARFLATAAFFVVFGLVLYQRSLPDMHVPPALCGALGMPSCTMTANDIGGALPILIMLFGRLPQIVQNQRQGHAGQLALITYLLNVAGSGARVFTVTQELDDKMALTSAVSSCLQNVVLVAQVWASPRPPLAPAPNLAAILPLFTPSHGACHADPGSRLRAGGRRQGGQGRGAPEGGGGQAKEEQEGAGLVTRALSRPELSLSSVLPTAQLSLAGLKREAFTLEIIYGRRG